jgi:hypothetical protein
MGVDLAVTKSVKIPAGLLDDEAGSREFLGFAGAAKSPS